MAKVEERVGTAGPELTTRVLGEQERFDQRQVVFARAAMGQLGPVVQERRRAPCYDPLLRVFFNSANAAWKPLVRAVDGPVNPERVEVPDPAHMSKHIKAVARFLGADLVGVTELNQAYVYSHCGVRHDPEVQQFGAEIDLRHRYAIAIGVEMDYQRVRSSPSFIDGSEVGRRYLDVAQIVCQLAAYIRELGYPARAHHFRQEEVLQVPIAVAAGLGELGRNGFMVSKEFGPRVRLGSVTTDLPLAIDSPVDLGVLPFCEECKKCATNCPSRSIPEGGKVVVRGVEKWQINPDTCLRYWASNPTKWFNCSLCIATCPWSKPNRWWHRASTWSAARSSLARKMLLWLDDLVYGKTPRYKMKWLDYVKE
jgi:reductive dehalogenase